MLITWIAILLSMVSIIWLIMLQTQKSKIVQTNSILQENLKQIEEKLVSNNMRGPRGPQGQVGRQGEQGQAGATYVARGMIKNVQYQGELVLDRLHGQGPSSLTYLNAPNLQTNQQWLYQADGTIRNQYDGTCLTGDTVSLNVYQAACDNNSNQQWNLNSNGQLIPKEDNQLCLDTTFNAQIQGTNKILQGNKLDSSTTHSNLQRVTLKNCNNSNNLSPTQQWVFS